MLKNLKHFLFKNLLMMEKFIPRQCSGTEQKKRAFFLRFWQIFHDIVKYSNISTGYSYDGSLINIFLFLLIHYYQMNIILFYIKKKKEKEKNMEKLKFLSINLK